ncbi:cellulose biosynthesis cyclic di-GMP-binding regulatory protein BcsB [Escherichia coli]|nr:cellulose biosynthesis cyclic di-GMP-binding regulatory protein BcsB [Escherichia coli]
MLRKLFCIYALAMGITLLPATAATPSTTSSSSTQDEISREVKLAFAQISPLGQMKLNGVNPHGTIEFGMRSDEVATKALLNLEYTPSPSLLPVQSQLKIYLNDELMDVLPITSEQLGKKSYARVTLNPLYMKDFNRVRVEFVGHYRQACENPTNSSLWVDVSGNSGLELRWQKIPLQNDLAFFPIPFFDSHDERPTIIPMVFAGSPASEQQQAAAIVASWFGSRSAWRGQQFPVHYNQLPSSNAIVFATNDNRPDFLNNYPAVDAPVVGMMTHPAYPQHKLLLILGRDDQDLLLAAKGIAQGNILFRGERVVVKDVKQLAARKPYDAPNWVRTDRPVTFAELKTWEGQLQSSGVDSAAIDVALNLPPDLFLLRNTGIDMHLKYRYTAPPVVDGAQMDISLNNQFLQSVPLNDHAQRLVLRLPLLQELLDDHPEVPVSALKPGETNRLHFNFEFKNALPEQADKSCMNYRMIENHAVIADDSTIDFSKYHHFLAMPDLRVFAHTGFPFSRMADLSETLVLMPKAPDEAPVSTLLNTVALIGAHTGFPAINLTITEDSRAIERRDADILLIGALPENLKDDNNIVLKQTQTVLSSSAAMAMVTGFESPWHEKRSVVALLAKNAQDYQLLNNALNDSAKRAGISGSLAIIRDSGIESLRSGDIYYVGHLPWHERLQYTLANHPVLLAVMAASSVMLLAWVLWRILRIISRHRLNLKQKK